MSLVLIGETFTINQEETMEKVKNEAIESVERSQKSCDWCSVVIIILIIATSKDL